MKKVCTFREDFLGNTRYPMYDKIKNIVIICMLAGIIIPFILLTDIFPFLRLGMFAEPVKKETQKELFQVSYIDINNKETVLDSKSIGIEPHFFLYLARNHYYRNESEKFIVKISEISAQKNIKEWQIKKIIIPLEKGTRPDTTVVYRKPI
ncbi:MAG: hypothetical protein K2X86_00480 [Cytophagaceae bacterium]|nr:hypothetical protein [Cytophagaceae bacterium]